MKFLLRVLIKAVLLYLAFNMLAGLVVDPHLGRISVYNHLVPGRPRFPFGESPREAYNFSLFDLDAMFASHEITAGRDANTVRVFVIGDSSVWGTLLTPDKTLAGQLNGMDLHAPDGRNVRFYNLGYPTISLTKDLMVMEEAKAYQPDLVIWLVTLEALPRDKQLSVPLVENNPVRTRELVQRYELDLPVDGLHAPNFWERSLIGRRKALADGIRLQLYGLMWAATGVDQVYPMDYTRAQTDLEADPSFHGLTNLHTHDLTLEALSAGKQMLGDTPLLVVNEPIMISSGANSDIRYNFYYPRKVYDQYREIFSRQTATDGLPYLDAWDIVPETEFTNSAIHLDPQGTARLASAVRDALAPWLAP